MAERGGSRPRVREGVGVASSPINVAFIGGSSVPKVVAFLMLGTLLCATIAANTPLRHPEQIVPPGKTYAFFVHGKLVRRLKAGSNVAALSGVHALARCVEVPCPGSGFGGSPSPTCFRCD